MSLSIPTLPHNLSSSRVLSVPNHHFLISKLSHLSLNTIPNTPFKTTTIRMGGGPRTFPGGVSKWQWKRMQQKKAKQLLKARLARERQIYEMRKRAELKAAVSELERPWEVVEKAPNLFSASADEQVKVLADRFQRPGGFDLWSDKDGPQLFETVDGLPSARFFPKGVVHSIKPYGRIGDTSDGMDELGNSRSDLDSENGSGRKLWLQRNGYNKNSRSLRGGSRGEDEDDLSPKNSKEALDEGGSGKGSNPKFRKKGNRRRFELADSSGSNELDSGRVGFYHKKIGRNRVIGTSGGHFRRGSGSQKSEDSNSEVYDMNLQHDGSYGF